MDCNIFFEKQDIGYAKLANLDPEYGLCKTHLSLTAQLPNVFAVLWILDCDLVSFLISLTDSSFVPPLIYAVMGSSRDIAIGPVAVVSLLLGTLLQSEIDPIANPIDYRRLAFTATFFAGITQATLGVLRYDTFFLT